MNPSSAPVTVRFLGSGDAFSASGNHQAGYLLRGDGHTCLLDCGATTLKAMKRQGEEVDDVDSILLSHLHGDHFGGLPFFFLEYLYQTPRQRPLEIIGPPGTEARVWDLYRAMYRDLAARPLTYPVLFREVQPGTVIDVGPCRVEPVRVPHQENEISLGYRVAVGGRTVLYSGDTGWTEDLLRYAEGTDLFICECCFFETRLDSHLDYPRLEREHARFATRRLILTHMGREVLARRAEIALEMAHDGLLVTV